MVLQSLLLFANDLHVNKQLKKIATLHGVCIDIVPRPCASSFAFSIQIYILVA